MEENNFIELSLNLERKLKGNIEDFFIENEELSPEDRFKIISVTVTSLIASTVYLLFKKNIGHEQQSSYIDQLCDLAKEQLKEGSFLIKEFEKEKH